MKLLKQKVMSYTLQKSKSYTQKEIYNIRIHVRVQMKVLCTFILHTLEKLFKNS